MLRQEGPSAFFSGAIPRCVQVREAAGEDGEDMFGGFQ